MKITDKRKRTQEEFDKLFRAIVCQREFGDLYIVGEELVRVYER